MAGIATQCDNGNIYYQHSAMLNDQVVGKKNFCKVVQRKKCTNFSFDVLKDT